MLEQLLPPINGSWVAYTPTLTGWTQGNGTIVGRYMRINSIVFFQISFSLGSTSTAPAATEPVFGMPPVPVKTGWAFYMRSTCRSALFDATGGSFDGAVYTSGTNNEFIRPMVVSTGSTYGGNAVIDGTIPFGWAVNDLIIISGWYPTS